MLATSSVFNCSLCKEPENVWWEDAHCLVIYLQENHFPILRVILKKHVAEMSDLNQQEQMHMMRIVFSCEKILRQFFKADKINLASLGNAVPHLHWHIIARFENDSHFPNSIWGQKLRLWNGVEDGALKSFFLEHFLKTEF